VPADGGRSSWAVSLVRNPGGVAARQVLAGREGGRHGYRPRVWSARGLLHVWDAAATDAIVQATSDEAWRVREMVARHAVARAADVTDRLGQDPVPRVRAMVSRALASVAGAAAPSRAGDAGPGDP